MAKFNILKVLRSKSIEDLKSMKKIELGYLEQTKKDYKWGEASYNDVQYFRKSVEQLNKIIAEKEKKADENRINKINK